MYNLASKKFCLFLVPHSKCSKQCLGAAFSFLYKIATLYKKKKITETNFLGGGTLPPPSCIIQTTLKLSELFLKKILLFNF